MLDLDFPRVDVRPCAHGVTGERTRTAADEYRCDAVHRNVLDHGVVYRTPHGRVLVASVYADADDAVTHAARYAAEHGLHFGVMHDADDPHGLPYVVLGNVLAVADALVAVDGAR